MHGGGYRAFVESDAPNMVSKRKIVCVVGDENKLVPLPMSVHGATCGIIVMEHSDSFAETTSLLFWASELKGGKKRMSGTSWFLKTWVLGTRGLVGVAPPGISWAPTP